MTTSTPLTVAELLQLTATLIVKNVSVHAEVSIQVNDHHVSMKNADDTLLAWIKRASVPECG